MPTLKRKDAAPESTWNRESTFASWAEWDQEYAKALAELPELKAFDGKLTESPARLADWFDLAEKHEVRLGELQGFASWAANVDSSDKEASSRLGQVSGLGAQLASATAFRDPQLLALGEELLDWADKEERLAVFRHFFHNLLRLQANTRSAEVEELLGAVFEPFDMAYRTYSELTNSDLKFEDAVDSKGEPYPVFQSTLSGSLQQRDRARRRSAWEHFYDGYLGMQNTLAANYQANVKQQNFLIKARGFDSVLEMRLAPNNLPTHVFHNLIEVFTANLPTWHRYWKVKAKLLGQDSLAPYDIWAPIVKEPPEIPYSQSIEWICGALEPLGADYVETMRRGSLEERWVDWAPNVEKRQGAASSRMVGRKPPYIFMSYVDNIFSLSTLAHELGHSMHSRAFALNQPIIYNNYGAISSTVTETASNFNQAMTRAHLRQVKGDDDNFQLAMIDEAMSNFHRYFFVMPTLARFENEVYEREKAGKAFNADIFNGIMKELFAEGYGETMADDPERTAITWATFLHLYIPFYTFQYAIGISAAHAAADRILAGEAGAVDGYLSMLAAGGSRYAMDLFKLAGVDMTSKTPIESAFAELEANVAKLEELAG